MNGSEMDVPAIQTISNTVRMARKKFLTDTVKVRTALEKFRTDDASHLNGTGKFLNG